jgi:hypothetical protein
MATLELIEGILRWKNKKWTPPTFNEYGLTKWFWMVQHPQNLKIDKYVDNPMLIHMSLRKHVPMFILSNIYMQKFI